MLSHILTALRQSAFGNRGGVLLYVLGSLLVLAAVGAGIALISPSAMQSKLEQEAGDRAFYSAQSGLSYILSQRAAYSNNGTGIANFIDAMGGDNVSTTYYLPQGGQFTYQLHRLNGDTGNGNYVISYLAGAADDVSGNPRYSYLLYGGEKGSSDNIPYSSNGPDPDDAKKHAYGYVLFSSNSDITIGGDAKIVGSIYGVNISGQQASVDGDIIAKGNVDFTFAVSISGDLCAEGTTAIKQSSVSGTLTSADSVLLNFDSHVGNNVFSGGNITMKNEVTVGNDTHAQGYISLKHLGVLKNNAYANSDIMFTDTKTYIENNAYSGGNISLYWGCKVINKAVATTAVNVVDGSSVGSSLITSTYPPNVRPIAPSGCLTVPSPTPAVFSAGTKKIKLGYQDRTYDISNPLPPGVYGALTTDNETILTLTAGTYYFDSISTNYGSTLNLDVSNGDITIFVANDADFDLQSGGINVSTDGTTWHSMADVDKEYAARVYLEAHDKITLTWGTKWFGTLFSTDSVDFKGDNMIIGAYATIGSHSLAWTMDVTYVASNYAIAHW